MALEKLSVHTITGGVWIWFFFFLIKIHFSLAMHEGIYFEISIPVAWPYCTKFWTNSHLLCGMCMNVHIPAEKSALLAPLPHNTVENRTVFLNQGHAWSTAEVQNMHKQTPLPAAWLWHKLEQHVYLNTPKQGRQRTATAWKPYNAFSTTLSTN